MKIVRAGLSPLAAVQMGVVNKTFDIFEKGDRGRCSPYKDPGRVDKGRCLCIKI